MCRKMFCSPHFIDKKSVIERKYSLVELIHILIMFIN